jgi:hypothetical protein
MKFWPLLRKQIPTRIAASEFPPAMPVVADRGSAGEIGGEIAGIPATETFAFFFLK